MRGPGQKLEQVDFESLIALSLSSHAAIYLYTTL